MLEKPATLELVSPSMTLHLQDIHAVLLIDFSARLAECYPVKNCALFRLLVLKEQCYSSITL